MELVFKHQDKTFKADLSKATDLSLPMDFQAENPNCYYAEKPEAEVITFGDSFVGSVEQGGTCNYQRVHITPHGNGTHTESVAHISTIDQSPLDCFTKNFFLTQVISLEAKISAPNDKVLLLNDLKEKMSYLKPEALVLRSLPNLSSKKNQAYSGTNPCYPEPGMGDYLRESSVSHWLVDLPSVDREEDGGKLLNHKGFWNFPKDVRYEASITELIYIPANLNDGLYLLEVQLPNLKLDAVPSRPLLYPIEEVK